jgi:hypothetical protein
MQVTAEDIRTAALTRYGTEPGAADDINAGTPVIWINATWGDGNYLTVQYGPALRLTDGTYLPAADLDITAGFLRKGRAGQDDTIEAAARRAANVTTTLPVEFTRAGR